MQHTIARHGLADTERPKVTPQHSATHCTTLQHAATRCNTLQHTATRCNTPSRSRYTAIFKITLQHNATSATHRQNTPCNSGATYSAADMERSQSSNCNTLQNVATPCNTKRQLQHTDKTHTATHHSAADVEQKAQPMLLILRQNTVCVYINMYFHTVCMYMYTYMQPMLSLLRQNSVCVYILNMNTMFVYTYTKPCAYIHTVCVYIYIRIKPMLRLLRQNTVYVYVYINIVCVYMQTYTVDPVLPAQKCCVCVHIKY